MKRGALRSPYPSVDSMSVHADCRASKEALHCSPSPSQLSDRLFDSGETGVELSGGRLPSAGEGGKRKADERE